MVNTSAQEKPQVRLYLDRVAMLHSMVRDWAGGMWNLVERNVEISEEDFGQYSAPALELRSEGALVATLEPIGASIIAADGRVDLMGDLGEQVIVYLTGSGPAFRTGVVGETAPGTENLRPLFEGVSGDGWYWIEDRRFGRARRLAKDLFFELIREVSDRAAA